jgi:hypothetical protein
LEKVVIIVNALFKEAAHFGHFNDIDIEVLNAPIFYQARFEYHPEFIKLFMLRRYYICVFLTKRFHIRFLSEECRNGFNSPCYWFIYR